MLSTSLQSYHTDGTIGAVQVCPRAWCVTSRGGEWRRAMGRERKRSVLVENGCKLRFSAKDPLNSAFRDGGVLHHTHAVCWSAKDHPLRTRVAGGVRDRAGGCREVQRTGTDGTATR